MGSVSAEALTLVLRRLEEGLARHLAAPDDEQRRDGLVQRFEFTYEQAHRVLKRFLEATSADPEAVDQLTFQARIRTGNEQGLLRSDWPTWRTYRELRSRTSHTYHEDAARSVVEAIPDFVEEARFLCDAIVRRQGQG